MTDFEGASDGVYEVFIAPQVEPAEICFPAEWGQDALLMQWLQQNPKQYGCIKDLFDNPDVK